VTVQDVVGGGTGQLVPSPPRQPRGAAPPPLVLPFDEVRALIAAYRRLVDELEASVAGHDAALGSILPGFRGDRAEAFLDGVADQLRVTQLVQGEVEDAIGELELWLRDASEADQQREAVRRAVAAEFARYAAERRAYLVHPRRNPFITPPAPAQLAAS
jgi:hypothetical protein